MRIIVVGANGTIGSGIVKVLSPRHEIVRVSRSSGDFHVDITSRDSIAEFYQRVGSFDALVCAAGEAQSAPVDKVTLEDLQFSINYKMLGQINLVLLGLPHIHDNGSFTLTGGILFHEPEPGSLAFAMVNGALEGFVRASSLDMPRGIRINLISPPWISETLKAIGRDPSNGISAVQNALAYADAVEGRQTGQIVDSRSYAIASPIESAD